MVSNRATARILRHIISYVHHFLLIDLQSGSLYWGNIYWDHY